MSYIDDHLLSGERVQYRTSLHWATLIGPGVFLLFGLVVLLACRALMSTALSVVPG